MVHVDRGSQYTSSAHIKLVSRNGLELSMSRKGNCWDNAVAESFFSTLKTELGISRRSIPTIAVAKKVIGEYIEQYYNRRRPHTTIGGQTPLDYEHNFRSTLELAA
jgi:transposase InsO family protein